MVDIKLFYLVFFFLLSEVKEMSKHILNCEDVRVQEGDK